MFFGKPEPVYERLVLGHVVGGGEVDLLCIFELVAFGRGEDDTGSKPVRILEPSKCIRQWVESGAGGRYWVSAQSTRKSASAWDLMVGRG